MVPADRRRRRLVVAAALVAMAATGGAHAADGPEGLQGTWRGPWYLGMTSGTAVLVLSGEPVSGGSLQMVNNERFGDQPVPLQDITYDGIELHFRARGADGRILAAAWPALPSARTLKAFVTYGGYKLRFELGRTEP